MKSKLLEKCAALEPILYEHPLSPLREVVFRKDKRAWQGFSTQTKCSAEETLSRSYQTGDRFILDFGETSPGHLELALDMEKAHNDSPVRLKFVFAEFPLEIIEKGLPLPATLSPSWLPIEIVTFDDLPITVRLPRRYQMRYLMIEVLGAPAYGLKFRKLVFHSCSAVDPRKRLEVAGSTQLFRKIDDICLRTLRNCMQTVFEDGPKRDRRLWLGDLRIQAKVNACTYRNFDSVEHSMYLLASFSNPDGVISADVYERPAYAGGRCFISDYAMLFSDLLLDHYRNTGRLSIVKDLFPVAEKQFSIFRESMHKFELFPIWNFIDWKDDLDRLTPELCIYVFGLRRLAELAGILGKKKKASAYRTEAESFSKEIRGKCFDSKRGLFVSGKKKQVSYASQIWAVLAEIVPQEEAAPLLLRLARTPEAVKPVTPYLQHHYAEALLFAGLKEDARAFISSYWGSMIHAGMDVCPEVFVPDQPFLSPYGGTVRLNSACHAWSCGASYFIRKYDL